MLLITILVGINPINGCCWTKFRSNEFKTSHFNASTYSCLSDQTLQKLKNIVDGLCVLGKIMVAILFDVSIILEQDIKLAQNKKNVTY